MVKFNQPIEKQAWQLEIQSLQEEFAVTTSPTDLLQRMSQYGLKATEVMGDYMLDEAKLNELAHSRPANTAEDNPHELESIKQLQAWPKQLNWVQFNQALEQLQYAWINDYQLGLTLDTAFLLARSLKLNVNSDVAKSTEVNLKFQCFLMHTLASITQSYDQHQFKYIQFFDLETWLPNQQLLISALTQSITAQENQPNKDPLGVLMIHLNINFEEKIHNGTQLVATSKDIVQAAAFMVQNQLNDDACLFRTGTQEFTILFTTLKYAAQLNLIAAKLSHTFESALPLNHITLILNPFFGGVCINETQASASQLLDSAKLALHHAMVNNIQTEVYDKLITTATLNQHQLDEAIIDALQQNELDLYVQPLVSQAQSQTPTNEHCASGEMLLRWPNEQYPFISPVRLIETIYKKGFGKVLVRWLINTACRRCAEMMTEHQRRFSFTINLGSLDLLDEDLPGLLTQAVTLWHIPAESLTIEITETDLLVNEEKVSKVLAEIVSLGFKLALDDFGTGYSSMARLRNMPIHLVKIDQSFVRNIAHSKEDHEIVQSIINLAHSLGKEVVAEGVEDLACLNLLKAMQCDKIQGYYYSKPMPFEQFMPWVANFEARRSV